LAERRGVLATVGGAALTTAFYLQLREKLEVSPAS
jgi:hypothetical protein